MQHNTLGASMRFQPETIKEQLSKGEKVDLSILNREARLDVINSFLTSEDLRPLEGLGDSSLGQMEFTGINSYTPDRFVARLDFKTSLGAGENQQTFNHLNLISANTAETSGSIIVPIVKCEDDEYVLMVSQFRPVIGKTTIELARGFADPDDLLESKPMKGALREFEEETGLISGNPDAIKGIKEVGEIYENTGTENVKNQVIRVDVEIQPEQLEQLKHHLQIEENGHQINTFLAPVSKAFGLLEDQHSLAALGKALAIS